MDKKTKRIIHIIAWVVCIVFVVLLYTVTGGELNALKSLDESYEVKVIVTEDQLEGFSDGNYHETEYTLRGEDVTKLRDILVSGIKARELFGSGLNVTEPESNKRIVIIANNFDNTRQFTMEIIYKYYLRIGDSSDKYCRNYHEELESEVLELLSGLEPDGDEVK